jgi:hypothetical protein
VVVYPLPYLTEVEARQEMELVKTVLRLSLSEALSPWLGMRDIVRVLGEAPKSEIGGSPVTMDLEKKKQRVSLHVRAIELEQEGISSIEEHSAVVLDKMAEADKASKFPEVRKVSHEAMFIESYGAPFHEVLVLVKQRFLRPSELVEVSTDVGIIFDQAEGATVKHYEFGPMAKEQLESVFLRWPGDKLPESFVFLHLKYEQTRAFTFEREYLKGFLKVANEWEVGQAQWVFGEVRKRGD